MGYRRNKVIKVAFADDHELAGLEVEFRRLTVRDAMEAAKLVDAVDEDANDSVATEQLVEKLVGNLVDWNLEDDDGQRVPCTLEAVLDLDMKFVLLLVNEMTSVITGEIPGPLAQPSSNGGPSPVESIPMDVLSPAPPS